VRQLRDRAGTEQLVDGRQVAQAHL
jgi:hypothetical protein